MRYAILFALLLNAGFLGAHLWFMVPRTAAAGGGATATRNGDINGDGALDISDVLMLLSYLFLGGPPPVPDNANLKDAPHPMIVTVRIDMPTSDLDAYCRVLRRAAGLLAAGHTSAKLTDHIGKSVGTLLVQGGEEVRREMGKGFKGDNGFSDWEPELPPVG